MSRLFGEPCCTVSIDATASKKKQAKIVSFVPFHIAVSIGQSKLEQIDNRIDRDRLIRKMISKSVAKLYPGLRKLRALIDRELTIMFACSTLLWPISLKLGGAIDLLLIAALYGNHRIFTANERFIRELVVGNSTGETPSNSKEEQ